MKVNHEQPQIPVYHKHHTESEQMLIHIMSGSIAGITSTFTGHPLDTIKTRMQVLHETMWHTTRTMVKQEGFFSLYKGIQSPLLSSPLTTATSFASYEISKRIVGIQPGQQITFGKAFLSGGIAGFFYAVVSTPVELIKVRLQMEGAGTKQNTGGTVNMVLNILKKEGIRGLYRGYWITCLRDMPGGAVQFGAYEALKNVFPNKNSRDSTEKNFIAGGLARFISWFFCHPQDLIKTRLQVIHGYAGIISCAKEIWHTYGSIGFWRGSLPSITRTLISGGVTFAVYEEAKKRLSNL